MRLLRGVCLAACVLTGVQGARGEGESATLAAAERTDIFRYDPFQDKVVPVPADQVKVGFLYNRFSPRLSRRVWSVAVEGGFLYAMAPGSVAPARQLDLRATPDEMRRELTENAPDLAAIMDVRGGLAYVRLRPDDRWELVQVPTIASVYDMADGRRWEWHGQRRVAVVHTTGNEWTLTGGRFWPVTYAGSGWPH